MKNVKKLSPQTQYISQTFTLSAPNLSINGFDLDATTFPAVYLSDPSSSKNSNNNKKKTRSSKKEPTEVIQYEPFDARKRARVEELARQEEDLMREIAALKRKLPGVAAQGYSDGFWDGVQKDEAAFAAAKERAMQEPIVDGGGDGNGNEDGQEDTAAVAADRKKCPKVLLDGVNSPLERQTEVQGTYAGVVNTLGRLKREMPATVAKMERARVAGEYVVTER